MNPTPRVFELDSKRELRTRNSQLKPDAPLQAFCGNGRLVPLLLCGIILAGCGNPPPAPVAAAKGTPTSSGTNAPAAKTELTAATNEFLMHKAVFAQLPGARDPFFPTSTRLPAAPSDSPSTDQAPPRLPLSSYIKLTGIRPSKSRPFAMINQTFFEPGERGEISISFPNASGTADVQKVRIRCLAIREDAVDINIEGEPGVTTLREPPQP